MPRIAFDDLPDHGRAWVFPATRPLEADERVRLLSEVDTFLDGWAAHGAPLRSGRELHQDTFLLIGVDEDASQPSGCSIDALVNRLDQLGRELGVRLIEHAPGVVPPWGSGCAPCPVPSFARWPATVRSIRRRLCSTRR